jgi:hypothetical protein
MMATITLLPSNVTYPDLQSAINASNSINNTIRVSAGTVTINTPSVTTIGKQDGLTILGNNQNIDGWSTSRNRESVIDFSSFVSCPFNGIEIASNDVTINGFTIQGNSCGPGISSLSTTTGSNILCNIIQNNSTGIILGSSPSLLDLTLVTRNLIQNNNNGASGDGIVSSTTLNNVSIINNHFTGNNNNSILIFTLNSLGVSDIAIDSNQSILDGGITIFGASNITITNNILDRTIWYGILIQNGVSNLTIAHNCILTSKLEGILIFGGSNKNSNITISPGNDIVCNGSSGIDPSPNIAILVTADAYIGAPGSLNATGNYFGPNLGQSPDNIIVDPGKYLNLLDTSAVPLRKCLPTPCDPINFSSNFVLCEEVCQKKETKCEKGKRVFYPSSIIVSAIGLGFSCSTLTFNPPSGSFFPLGLTLVLATDENKNIFSFFVSVRGAAPPFKTHCEKIEKKKNSQKTVSWKKLKQ